MKSRSLIIGMAVGLGLLYFAIREVDMQTIVANIAGSNPVYVAVFALCTIAFYALKVIRWKLLLGPQTSGGYRILVSPMMIGFAANNLLPFRAGEALRVVVASNLVGRSKSFVLATVVAERFFDLLAVSAIVLFGALVISTSSNSADSIRSSLVVPSVVAVAIAVVAVVLISNLTTRRVVWIIRYLPERWQSSCENILEQFTAGLDNVRSLRKLVRIVINSLAQWFLLSLSIYVSMRAVGLPADVWMSIIVMGILIIGVSLPAAPGYIGTVEYSFILALGYFEIDATAAFSAAIYYHALNFTLVTLSGALGALYLRKAKTTQTQADH